MKVIGLSRAGDGTKSQRGDVVFDQRVSGMSLHGQKFFFGQQNAFRNEYQETAFRHFSSYLGASKVISHFLCPGRKVG